MKEGTRVEYSPDPIVFTHVPSFAANVVGDGLIGKTFNRSVKHSNINLHGWDVALKYSFLTPTSVSGSD